MDATRSPDLNRWELWFPVVAQTRDYGGAGRPISGDQRLPYHQAAHRLVKAGRTPQAKVRLLLVAISVWRLAAEDGLVPHPGEIPNGCVSLQDVPGWEDTAYPPSQKFKDYFARVVLDKVPTSLPHRDDTVQCDRIGQRFLTPLPLEYETLGETPPRHTLDLFTNMGQVMLNTTDWTASEIRIWQERIVPMLNELIDHIPSEAWEGEHERKGA